MRRWAELLKRLVSVGVFVTVCALFIFDARVLGFNLRDNFGKKSQFNVPSTRNTGGGTYTPTKEQRQRQKEDREREQRQTEARQQLESVQYATELGDDYFSKGQIDDALLAYQRTYDIVMADNGFNMTFVDGSIRTHYNRACEQIKLITENRKLDAEEAKREQTHKDAEARVTGIVDALAEEFEFSSSQYTSVVDLRFMDPDKPMVVDPRVVRGEMTPEQAREAREDGPDSIVNKEQSQYENSNKEWLSKQQDLIRQVAASEKKRNIEILSAMSKATVPNLPPKSLNDLKSGDIILLKPDSSSRGSRAIPYGDLLSRWVHGSHTPQKYDISHSVVYLKTVNGKRLYLDHTIDDKFARIIDEDIFLKRYGKRLSYVARPKAVIDGKKLWAVARKAALKDNTPYGVFGKSVVCSELDRFAVVQASGRRLPLNETRFGPDITPADFIDPETEGKYFVVTPLKK